MPVTAGDKFRITAVYDNPTAAPIDAMAGLFIFLLRGIILNVPSPQSGDRFTVRRVWLEKA